jgi:hypothetical protein
VITDLGLRYFEMGNLLPSYLSCELIEGVCNTSSFVCLQMACLERFTAGDRGLWLQNVQ